MDRREMDFILEKLRVSILLSDCGRKKSFIIRQAKCK